MKKIVLLLAAMVFSFSAYEVQAQNTSANQKPGSQFDTRRDNLQYWMEGAQKGLVKYNPKIQVKPAEYHGSELNVKGVATLNSPDVPVTDQTDVTESENSIFVDPNDYNYVLNSNNSTAWSGGSVGALYGTSYLQSADGGLTFGGSVQAAGGENRGDPAAAINQDGRQFVGYISSSGGMGVSYSDDGTNWTPKTVYNSGGQDKNHMWVDNSMSSPYEGNLYNVWSDLSESGANNNEIVFSRSTDNGDTWSSVINISSAVNAGSHNQGCNVQTGPNGEVYVVWAIYDDWPTDETAMGFAKSTDGGATFAPATRIITNIKGIRNSGVSKNHRVNSFPSMAVDISGGSNNGNIYISWTNIGTPGVNTGSNRSVYIVNSTDDGATWSTAVRINQGPFDDDREAYFPWITCDGETGTLAAVFYDDRNTSSTDCEAFSAYSLDAGATWTDFVVSDVSFTPAAIPGLAGGYMGDYLAITSKDGIVYPCWTDNRGGLYMTYVSAYGLGLNAQFTADETEICNGSAVTFNDVSTGEPITWEWSFPGGSPNSFSGQNPPAITYSAVGSYTVTLTVSDGTENDTEVKTDFVTVKDVIADFSGTPTTVVIGNTVTFTDESSCGPTSWTWSFPGGTPDSYTGQTPPAIQYDVEGNYDVTLTVTNAAGTDTKTYDEYITVMPPEFPMTNGTVTTCMGNFYDSGGPNGSYGNNENFTMTFYAGTTGDMIRFNFTEFDVEAQTTCNYDKLSIFNGEDASAPLLGEYCGTDSPGIVTANNTIGALTFVFTSDGSVPKPGWIAEISCYSGTEPPLTDFVASTTTPGLGADVFFTDLTMNLPTSWEWSFDPTTFVYINGTNENSQNPEVHFNEVGLYTVSLTTTNEYGSDTETKTDYIDVNEHYNMTDGTVTTCTGTFFDSGGPDENYQNSENFTMTFYPDAGGAVEMIFNEFDIENSYDNLNIYDGENASAPLIGTFTGTTSPGTVTATNAEGALTFNFTSDASITHFGWVASIGCIYGFEAPSNFSAVVTGNDVALTWDAPANGEQTGYNIYRNGEMLTTLTETNYDDMDLEDGSYNYCVSAVYNEGESGQVCTSVYVGEPIGSFFDDFESGPDKWVFTGDWGLTEEHSYSTSHSLADSPGGNYLPDQETYATMASSVDLSDPSVLSSYVSWWMIMDIENGNFDYLYVEASDDDFANFITLASFFGQDMLEPWVEYSYSLGSFIGSDNVKVRFHFSSDQGFEVDGCYIDDFMITTSDVDEAAPEIFFDAPFAYEANLNNYEVMAVITDVTGVASAEISYSLEGVAQDNIVGVNTSGDNWQFTIPLDESDAGSQIDYRIEAVDSSPAANAAITDTASFISGVYLGYDNAFVNFYQEVGPDGTGEINGTAVKFTIEENHSMVTALIRNYADQSVGLSDEMVVHIWSDGGNGPGDDLIDPITMFPEANLVNTNAFTRIDLRPFSDVLGNILAGTDIYIGFTVPSGIVRTTITQPAIALRSYTFDGSSWIPVTDDYHFRVILGNTTVGIKDNELSFNTQIYPNPASNVVNVKSDLQISNVKVYNNTGQIVSNKQVNSKFFQLNTSQYETGIYFFQIETNEGVISKRIIIQ
jgi:PKD repeat protein